MNKKKIYQIAMILLGSLIIVQASTEEDYIISPLKKFPSSPIAKKPLNDEEIKKCEQAHAFLAAIPYWTEESRKRIREDE